MIRSRGYLTVAFKELHLLFVFTADCFALVLPGAVVEVRSGTLDIC